MSLMAGRSPAHAVSTSRLRRAALISLTIGSVLAARAALAVVTGSLTVLSFPGASAGNCGYAEATGGTVTTDTTASDVGTLTDGNGVVVGGFSSTWTGSFTNTVINFTIQPTRNPIHMVEVLDGVTVVDLYADDPCLAPSAEARIPTLNAWGLGAIALLVAGAGLLALRRSVG